MLEKVLLSLKLRYFLCIEIVTFGLTLPFYALRNVLSIFPQANQLGLLCWDLVKILIEICSF